MWSEGYYVSTMVLNEETKNIYIREQDDKDITMDKLSVKEYEDQKKNKAPFGAAKESMTMRLEQSKSPRL